MNEPGELIRVVKLKSSEPPHIIKKRKARELNFYRTAEGIANKTYEVGQDEPKKSPKSHQKRVLAKHIGSAMIQQDRENQEALKETVLVGEIDPLTGLSNRRGLQRAIDREIDRIFGENNKQSHQRRTDESDSFFPQAVLVSLDLNGLKTKNDVEGHSAGDRMLVQAAELINKHTRLLDTVARVGGDEFIVLLTGLTLRDAINFTKRLLFTHGLNATAGIAPLVINDPQGSLDRADLAERAAKDQYHKTGITNFNVFTTPQGEITDGGHPRG